MKIIKPMIAVFRKFTKLRAFTIGAILALTFGFTANANADHILWASTGNTNGTNEGGRIYTINPETGSVTLVGDTTLHKLGALAFDNSGVLYGIAGGSRGPADLYTIDTNTAAATFVGTVMATNLNGIDAIDFDSLGTLFATGWFGANPVRLLTLNPSTAGVDSDDVLIGGTGNGHVPGLAFDATDQLFGSRGNSGGHLEDLVSINTTSFMQAAIGGSTDDLSDIAFTRDGTLYGGSPATNLTGGGLVIDSELFTIDPTTGVKTSLIASTGIRIAGLATHDNPIPTSGAPVEGPNGNFYEVVASPGTSWDAAHTAATNLTYLGVVGHLATITSAEEDAFVDGLRVAALGVGSASAWIGGSQPDGEATPQDGWAWVNGEGSIPGVNTSTLYANWNVNEPNDFPGTGTAGVEDNEENRLASGFYGPGGGWNDENGAATNPYIVEYDVASKFIPPGEDQTTADGANNPDSPHGVSAGYQEVLEGGNWTIKCCTVEDWREGMGTGKKYGAYLPVDLDLGVAIDVAAAGPDTACQDLQVYDKVPGPGKEFGSEKAKLHPWQRAVPANPALPDRKGTRVGVCLIQSEVIAQGVLFTEEEPANVLGYTVDCTVDDIDDRPYTSGVAILPTDVDSPYAVRESADCNRSRSGKRSSDRLIVLNEWHYTKHKKTQPYLSMFAASLLQVIDDERTRPGEGGELCVDNSQGFLDNLTSYLQTAKNNMKKKGDPQVAEDALNDATRLALLIGTGPRPIPLPTPLPASDPYLSSTFCDANNAQGLFVGRFMALKFANCSEKLHPNDSSSSSSMPPACVIEPDIFAEMPPLP